MTTRSKSFRALLLLIAFGVVLSLTAAPPPWWSSGVIDPTKQADDYAAVNQGQLKNIAKRALAAMDASFAAANLPVDQADALHALVNSWNQPGASSNDYNAVNLGQLKNVAKPFYEHLQAVHYTDRFPWTGATTPANDYAAANIGQVKNLFSFDFTKEGAGLDLDRNGLADYWEIKYLQHTGVDPNQLLVWGATLTVLQAYQQGTNPDDYVNQSKPTFTIVSGTPQTGRSTEYVLAPLGVSVTDKNGQALANAPITFTVTQGGGELQPFGKGTGGASVAMRTNGDGLAKALFQLPNTPNNTSLITATLGGGAYTLKLTFTEHTNGEIDPQNPSGVAATMNSDGSGDVIWTNNADPSDTEPIDIMYKDRNGVWQVLATVPAGTMSYHIPAQ